MPSPPLIRSWAPLVSLLLAPGVCVGCEYVRHDGYQFGDGSGPEEPATTTAGASPSGQTTTGLSGLTAADPADTGLTGTGSTSTTVDGTTSLQTGTGPEDTAGDSSTGAPPPPDLVGCWILLASDANGTSWSDSVLDIEAQTPTNAGYELAGTFTWVRNGVDIGTEEVFGTLAEPSGAIQLTGYEVDRDLVTGTYEAHYDANADTIVDGTWSGGVPGTWSASRLGTCPP